jgi:hypothetical protein
MAKKRPIEKQQFIEKVYTLKELQTAFFEHVQTHAITRNSITEQILILNSETIDLLLLQLVVQLRISNTPEFPAFWGSSVLRQLMEMRLIGFRKLTEEHRVQHPKLYTNCFRHFFYEIRKTLDDSAVHQRIEALQNEVVQLFESNEFLVNKYIVHAASLNNHKTPDEKAINMDIKQIWHRVLTMNRLFLLARQLVQPEASISLTHNQKRMHVQDIRRIFLLNDAETAAANALLYKCSNKLDTIRVLHE